MPKIEPLRNEMHCSCGGKLVKKGSLNSAGTIFGIYKCDKCNNEKMVAEKVL
jgi:hypothetical protein